MEIIMDVQSQKANNAEPWNDSVLAELENLQGNELFWYSEAHASYSTPFDGEAFVGWNRIGQV